MKRIMSTIQLVSVFVRSVLLKTDKQISLLFTCSLNFPNFCKNSLKKLQCHQLQGDFERLTP